MPDFLLSFIKERKGFVIKLLTLEEQIQPITHLSYIWEEKHSKTKKPPEISRAKTL